MVLVLGGGMWVLGGGLGLCGNNRESSQRILRTTLLNQVTMSVIGKLVIEYNHFLSYGKGRSKSLRFQGIYNPLYTSNLR